MPVIANIKSSVYQNSKFKFRVNSSLLTVNRQHHEECNQN